MRLSRIFTIGAAAGAGLAIGYGELVRDWRIGRSEQTAEYNLGVDSARSLTQVYGIFAIGSKGTVGSRFPFHIAPDQNPAALQRAARDTLATQFATAPKEWLAFSDSEWTIDRCMTLPAGLGLGRVGEALHLGDGMACVVTWKGPRPASMLISVSRADSNSWMRPFVRRLCHAITQTALNQIDPSQRNGPKYAACILADRPTFADAAKTLTTYVYSVGLYHTLALMTD